MIVKQYKISTMAIALLIVCSCSQNQSTKPLMNKEKSTVCSEDCTAKNKSKQQACKLTTPELRERKETVLSSLKEQVIEKRELKNGFAFKFPGTGKVLDELTEFIKTERACCDFFTFNLSISGDKSEAWLKLTGEDGVKDFITTELGLTE